MEPKDTQWYATVAFLVKNAVVVAGLLGLGVSDPEQAANVIMAFVGAAAVAASEAVVLWRYFKAKSEAAANEANVSAAVLTAVLASPQQPGPVTTAVTADTFAQQQGWQAPAITPLDVLAILEAMRQRGLGPLDLAKKLRELLKR